MKHKCRNCNCILSEKFTQRIYHLASCKKMPNIVTRENNEILINTNRRTPKEVIELSNKILKK
jgi:hypothetical protein